jgi:hypothetical protein
MPRASGIPAVGGAAHGTVFHGRPFLVYFSHQKRKVKRDCFRKTCVITIFRAQDTQTSSISTASHEDLIRTNSSRKAIE